MDFIKTIIGKLEIHVNFDTKTLQLRYCGSELHLYFGNDNKLHLDTKLVLEGSDQQEIEDHAD